MTPLLTLLSQHQESIIHNRAKTVYGLSENQARDKRTLNGNWTHTYDKYVGDCAVRGDLYQHDLQYRIHQRKAVIKRLVGSLQLAKKQKSFEYTTQVLLTLEKDHHWKKELGLG